MLIHWSLSQFDVKMFLLHGELWKKMQSSEIYWDWDLEPVSLVGHPRKTSCTEWMLGLGINGATG